MKIENRSIIITDPCYVIRAAWTDDVSVNIFTGSGLRKYGFTDYIWKNTIYGDWDCSIIKIPTTLNPKEEFRKIIDGQQGWDEVGHEDYVPEGSEDIGKFCADAGLVAVFFLDELEKFNSEVRKFAAEYSHCATIIENWTGEIEYYVEDGEYVSIIGKGKDSNFLTIQGGL